MGKHNYKVYWKSWLNIMRVMEAVGDINAEGVNELWSVSSAYQNHHISSIYSIPSHNLTKASLNEISIVICIWSACKDGTYF